MNNKDDAVYVRHILDAIEKIEHYTEGLDEEKFRANSLVQDGVIRQLEIIGEAVLRLSVDLRERHPDTPWGDIIGMRNRLIHEYFGVDLAAVWLTVVRDVPELKQMMQDVVQTL